MSQLRIGLMLSSLLLGLIPGVARAHMPLTAGNNDRLEGATFIPDARYSWVVYTTLPNERTAHYYRFDALQGERIPISLFTSPEESAWSFVPSMIVMGPGLTDQAKLPDQVRQPPNIGRQFVDSEAASDMTFEAFSPSTFERVAEVELVAPEDGTYYVAVFDSRQGGRYGVAIGAGEKFALVQWILLPFKFPAIYAWTGQTWASIFAPAVLLVVAGVGLLRRRIANDRSFGLRHWAAAVGGLFIAASGVTVAYQLFICMTQATPDRMVVVTLVLIVVPILLGALVLRRALRPSARESRGSRIGLMIAAGVALFFWSGWLLGPILLVVAALAPSRAIEESNG